MLPTASEPHLTISSPQNERIKAVRRLQRAKERKATGKTLLEGPHLLEAALVAGIVPEMVFAAEADPLPWIDSEVIRVSDEILGSIAPTETPRGPIAVIDVPTPDPLEARRTVVLWDVADPGNTGTLIRSAAALGWSVARHGGADPWSPKVLRAAAGAHFTTAIAELVSHGELAEAALSSVATAARGGVAPDSISTSRPIALLIGNEANGLPADVVDGAEAVVTIPIGGVESLNAAVAGSIAMYALRT